MPTARTRLFLVPSQALSAAFGTGSAEFGSHNGLRTSRRPAPQLAASTGSAAPRLGASGLPYPHLEASREG